MSDTPQVLGTKIEIIQKEEVRVAKITLNNETFRTEAGAMFYMRGDITMESKAPSIGGFLKAAVTKESIFRPTYTGIGELYLEPTANEIHIDSPPKLSINFIYLKKIYFQFF